MFDSSDDDDQEELPRRQRKVWRTDWVGQRNRDEFCAKLYSELRTDEPTLYHNLIGLQSSSFESSSFISFLRCYSDPISLNILLNNLHPSLAMCLEQTKKKHHNKNTPELRN